MPYEVGVSSGWWQIGKAPELLGLGMKIASVTTYGVNYVQADFENTAEFTEPDVVNQIRKAVEDLGIKWGSHGEIGEFMAWESAVEVMWKQSHRRLHQYLDGLYKHFVKSHNEKYMPEYINFHSSNTPAIGLFVERFRYTGHIMVDFEGNSDWTVILDRSENKGLKKWFLENLIFLIIARESGIAFLSKKQIIEDAAEMVVGQLHGGIDRRGVKTDESLKSEVQDYVNAYFSKEDSPKKEAVSEALYQLWKDLSRLRVSQGALAYEEFAYAIVAKYLEFNKNNGNEPIWNMFFHGKTIKDLENEWSSPEKKVELVDEEKGLINLMPDLVAMVASRYILGHFKTKNLPEFRIEIKKGLELEKRNHEWDPFYDLTPLEKLDRIKILIGFENPEILEGQREGLQRIIHAYHIYLLVKAMNSPYFKIFFDAEHYVHNGLDPLKEIQSCPEDFGNYVYGFHIGAPKPYHPAHEPVDVGSEAQRWIYVYAYALRKKGFGMKTKGLLIFERGGARGGQNPGQFIAQSGIALKLIADELDKNTDPAKLPPRFFGVSPEGMLSEEKQMAVIREHARDPLKGLISTPEEEYTFLSSAAIGKGKKPEEWKKEELK